MHSHDTNLAIAAASALAAAGAAPLTTSEADVWRSFAAWCTSRAEPSLPALPTTVRQWLDGLDHASSSVAANVIGGAHLAAGFEDPCVDR